MATNLDTLIAAIPTAEDGHAITREYHNSLRAALVAIASQLSDTATGQTLTTTFAPTFSPNIPQPPWVITQGVASKSDQTISDGWLPISLPQGARIRGMIVKGGRSGAAASFQIQLIRQSLDDPDANVILISIPGLTTPATEREPFEAKGLPQVSGITSPAALNEILTADNEGFKYLVKARLVGAATGATVRIYGIRVEYLR
jgi:hypothetical protein